MLIEVSVITEKNTKFGTVEKKVNELIGKPFLYNNMLHATLILI